MTVTVTSEGGYVFLPTLAFPAKRIMHVLLMRSSNQVSVAVEGLPQPAFLELADAGECQAAFDLVVAAAWSAGASLVSLWDLALDPERLAAFEHLGVAPSGSEEWPWAHTFTFTLTSATINTVVSYDVVMSTADPMEARLHLLVKLREQSPVL